MFSKDFWNFAIGMVLGIFANYFWVSSPFLYYFVFVPCAIIIFIMINYRYCAQTDKIIQLK